MAAKNSAERVRLAEAEQKQKHWLRWGPYLSERSWGTVREDYSENGDAWNYFPHDHARSRAYRWTEDGILGLCDNHQYLCLALAFWNGVDPILKERLFGLTGPQGNHGEDVKELYYYLDATPTGSYLKGLYKYPHRYPYSELVDGNVGRSRTLPEFEITDTDAFAENRYFDITAEYAKNDVDDVLLRVTIVNHGPESAPIIFLPTLWFRNTWTWGKTEGPHERPKIFRKSSSELQTSHVKQGSFTLQLDGTPQTLFTGNETNTQRLYGLPPEHQFTKDAFHEYLILGNGEAINPSGEDTKACAVYHLTLRAGEQRAFLFRLARTGAPNLPRARWDEVFARRIFEADEFYSELDRNLDAEQRAIQRQAFAGMFWSKQYYHYVVETWFRGDADEPAPPPQRQLGRNKTWRHLFNDDVISMPDKWEYPWYAAWDLAFHTVAIAPADPDFAKSQLSLFLREWYMHPNGQLPAYEWSFSDVNPPVHAWACYRVFQIDRRLKGGEGDLDFLERVFHKLLMNFTWWVNRKDSEGANIFEGGFLGLDNIGIFDRSAKLPPGWLLEQSDGSSWMAMYCLHMLKIALELSTTRPTYEDIASKFFEHFLHISDAMNHTYRTGLWDEKDHFYYDRLRFPDGNRKLLRVRSLVGIMPLFAADTLEWDMLDQHPGFKKRMEWFIENRPDLTEGLASLTASGMESRRLLGIVNRDRLALILQRVFDEEEFLSPFGIRSVSRFHRDNPCIVQLDGREFRVDYEPGESQTAMFGGNSNWRGPVWFPMNFLLIEALQRLNHFYGDEFLVEFPTRSDNWVNLHEAARLLSQRLISLFVRDEKGERPVYGNNELFQHDPNFRNYVLFYEFFHGDTGLGLGASHQTGWTGLVAKLLHQSGTNIPEAIYTHPMPQI